MCVGDESFNKLKNMAWAPMMAQNRGAINQLSSKSLHPPRPWNDVSASLHTSLAWSVNWKGHATLSCSKAIILFLSTQMLLKGPQIMKTSWFPIDCKWLVKLNGATFIFIGKLGNKFLPGQFWPCLSFASLSVSSGMALSPDFWSCGPKLRHLYCCDLKLWGDGVGK